ncbi:uncharacterized protein METZ01_LOCUS205849 [marine metagenome]|uniref:AB hydrolase-1 domain-containing protein n=1 Tax=marine metagenome TaxID=408172 RepID=A0A382ERI5_9ZZZZ
MPFVATNSIELYYEIHGSGYPVVFAHGSGGNHLSWWQQIPFFSQHYTCITFDHRSFGLSKDSAEPRGREAFADDLKGLLDYLDLGRVALVAHSMGGRTAVGFTLRNPERVSCMVLSGSNGGSVNDESRGIWHENQEKASNLPRNIIRGLSQGFVEKHPYETFLYREILRINPRLPSNFLAVTPGYRGSTHDRLTATGVPILYVVGDQDVLAPRKTIEIAASQIPMAQFLNVREAGHSVYYEQPELFNREVYRFLRECIQE